MAASQCIDHRVSNRVVLPSPRISSWNIDALIPANVLLPLGENAVLSFLVEILDLGLLRLKSSLMSHQLLKRLQEFGAAASLLLIHIYNFEFI